MNTAEIRQKFLQFFNGKNHKIVPSAPIVIKNDPTLLFTNAGMNQFKDYFLGNKTTDEKKVTDTQKCLRVSGKHNDLEEVGVDHYHHTMFEMLGNWSFGDYFKKEAIDWAWELLTEVYNIDKERLYITYFEGDKQDGLQADDEARKYWEAHVPVEKILACDKKDNFWEMGETGPCGPCSEIHIDLRPQDEIDALPGRDLVNKDHEQVIEIWNLVFIQYNRKANRSLEDLPERHVDTGMGLERLARVLQGKSSNYDIDVFQKIIKSLESSCDVQYKGGANNSDVAFRVIADHIRAICTVIGDGQLPSNTGAGYVVRRVLRRAVRYAYSFLDLRTPFLFELVNVVVAEFGDVFPELKKQEDFIIKVVLEEEKSFLNTLEKGLNLLNPHLKSDSETITGEVAFELYDTYGFPIDLTQLIAKENSKSVDIPGFEGLLKEQKDRSKADAKQDQGDWIKVQDIEEGNFIGYDIDSAQVSISRYREISKKGKTFYQLVLDKTPFYPEGGGQVGDKGILTNDNGDKTVISDTQKENDLILHFTDKLPENLSSSFEAKVDVSKRRLTERNHSATHLVHAALKSVLGDHVEQRGSLVNHKQLRFDFSHISKMSEEEISEVEKMVNEKIKAQIPLDEQRNLPFDEAQKQGATALFGEKYGDTVRVISFGRDYSMELCGGTHVKNTMEIGHFKLMAESSVAAGVRRIECITSEEVDKFIQKELDKLDKIDSILGNPKDLISHIDKMNKENKELRKKMAALENEAVQSLKSDLKQKVAKSDGKEILIEKVSLPSADGLKDILFGLSKDHNNFVGFIAANIQGKPMLGMIVSENLAKEGQYHAGNTVREVAKEIKGGGGGQNFFATAGGKDLSGLDNAIVKAKELLNL